MRGKKTAVNIKIGKKTVAGAAEIPHVGGMPSTQDLINIADAYKAAAGISKDTTVSSRVFNDGKKLAALRAGGDITVGRFNEAMAWFQKNWPAGAQPPTSPGKNAERAATQQPARSDDDATCHRPEKTT